MDAPKPTRDFAKALRRRMTLPEVLLWTAIKGRKLDGLHFRKQHPMGRYVLDFYCAEAKLAVEIDGQGHGSIDQGQRDSARDTWLRTQGVRTLRVSARFVLESVEGVLGVILAEVRRGENAGG